MSRRLVVWVEGWQHECCGDAFGIGTEVTWRLVPGRDPDLGDLLGRDLLAEVNRTADHHDPDEEGTVTTATVTRIRAVGAASTVHEVEVVDARDVGTDEAPLAGYVVDLAGNAN